MDTRFHPCAASSGFTLHSSLTQNPSTALFYLKTASMEAFSTLSISLGFVCGSHTFEMHTCTCSHLLLLTYASRNTHAHISAACGWHPQCCETSCIPHAYITPFPPPPADHSSFYPAFALSLSLSLPLIEISPAGALRYQAKFLLHSGHHRTHPYCEIRLKSENLTHKYAQPVTTQTVTLRF